jgi:hypothetical protein
VDPIHYTPDYAKGESRVAFYLRIEDIILLPKMAGLTFTEDELNEQLTADIRRFNDAPDRVTLVCFIYDPQCVIEDPSQSEKRLSGDRDRHKVRILVTRGHCPNPEME